MADGRSNNGGKREGAGRKKMTDEKKAVERLKKALRSKYSSEDDEEAIEAFLIEFSETKEGMKFFAEHLLGKPTDKIDHTTDGESLNDGPFKVIVVPKADE